MRSDGQALTLRANTLLPGLYAWVTTVAYPATYRGVPSSARVTAFVALVALLVGPILVLDRPRLGRAVGIYVFVGSSLATWLLLGPALGVERLEPTRSALGGIGWGLFALGWGSLRRVGTVPEDDPHVIPGAPLVPRSRVPAKAVVILGLGLGGALPPLLLAWRAVGTEHALLAHSAALLCALAIVNAASIVALGRGTPRSLPSARQRIRASLRPALVLLAVLALGIVGLALR
jgi:hypothetical protein